MSAFLRQQNRMLEEMNKRMTELSNTMLGFVQQQNTATEATKRAEKAEKALNKELVTREEVLNKAFKKLGEGGQEVKKFEIFSKKSFDAFITSGGNAFDFFDLALSNANQRVKIFGVEAALARKIMYGFLPPGMFRLVNKLSTSFRFLGGIFRKTSADGENIDNIFKKMIRGLVSFPKLLNMNSKDVKQFFGKFRELDQKRVAKNKLLGFEDYSKDEIKAATNQVNKIKRAKGYASSPEGKKALEEAEASLKHMKEVRAERIKQTPRNIKAAKFLNALKAAPKFLGQALMFFSKMMLYTGIFLMIAYVLWKTVGKTVIETLREIRPAIEVMIGFVVASLGMVWDGISSIFNAFFGDGNLGDVIDGVIQIAVGLLSLALSVAGVLLVALGGFVVKFIGLAVSKTIAFLIDSFTTFEGFAKAIPVILGISAAILAFMMGAPIWLAALAFVVLYKIGKWLVGKIKDAFSFNATGGLVNNDMTIVGEKGPELVSLPRGSRVHSNSNSKRMARGSGVVNNFNITINAKDTSKAEMRRIADEIGRMVSSKINRRTSNRSSV